MQRHALKILALGLLLLANPATAQERNSNQLNVLPDAAAPRSTARAPSSPVYLGSGPINMRAGAYIARDPNGMQAYQNQQQQSSYFSAYGMPSTTSAGAYNQQIQQRRSDEQRRSGTAIPSPFPPGFGSP